MPKKGHKKNPIVINVHSATEAQHYAAICAEHGWHFIIGMNPHEPVDLRQLEEARHPPEPLTADARPDRNAPCPCGSGKKFKKCCGA
ncbi:MAG: hypothetical protein OZSIB_3806 [Candidatus Ozemobacter sibiricus]|jgi:SWIM/SEC-C metal-binding protein|uniref:Protein export cytoplasm protein SecA ATPase RNA helicase n=1 Tax=Candidatus Ozemobacter sibiricus TaxID=2268124 RepID=A0A367ZQ31_9BACT|nr:MAG: hypothetical protein OZSIB_3806 [Candidatus Ozemobacter sibiricus]